MGRRVIQKDYVCAICGHDAEDGETMWEMGNEIWCELCCDIDVEDDQEQDPIIHLKKSGSVKVSINKPTPLEPIQEDLRVEIKTETL